jgi:hypothetical protein
LNIQDRLYCSYFLPTIHFTSRSLFFVLVIATTRPGAFFWKNEGFDDHARATDLADAPQHGVVYERQHAFKVDELLQTIRENA